MKDKIRVLLVDDEERFTLNMARILKGRGLEVATAFNGYEALNAVKYGGGFDVVLLDIKMPGMDGIETLGEIKKRAPDTEVIMLTGQASVSSGAQAMRKGAYDYLIKPCDIEDLVEKIREAHEAESIKRHPVLWPRKLVREIVLPLFPRLKPGDSFAAALELMSRGTGDEAVEEVHIVDDEDQLLGMVSKRDLLNEAQKARPDTDIDWAGLQESPDRLLPHKTLREVMRTDSVATQANATLTDAANQMIAHHIRRMPVIRAGKVIGVVRLQDIFQHLDHEIE